ncbi:uncharacterized protein BDV14DRAFT_4597 [Aspergillus stella-maris]|uniref:uncharacterized protein n=1 Tax=Aspergillus stella-maris TaxID=1810926 RepID=UPI003CCCBC6C
MDYSCLIIALLLPYSLRQTQSSAHPSSHPHSHSHLLCHQVAFVYFSCAGQLEYQKKTLATFQGSMQLQVPAPLNPGAMGAKAAALRLNGLTREP